MEGSPEDNVAGAGQPESAPGWHADPTGKAVYRYWDGSAWTEHTAYDHEPQPQPPPEAEPAPMPPPDPATAESDQSPTARRILEWTDAANQP
jgi:hypothetical protein